jgi:hypothetical protein
MLLRCDAAWCIIPRSFAGRRVCSDTRRAFKHDVGHSLSENVGDLEGNTGRCHRRDAVAPSIFPPGQILAPYRLRVLYDDFRFHIHDPGFANTGLRIPWEFFVPIIVKRRICHFYHEEDHLWRGMVLCVITRVVPLLSLLVCGDDRNRQNREVGDARPPISCLSRSIMVSITTKAAVMRRATVGSSWLRWLAWQPRSRQRRSRGWSSNRN